MTEAAHGLDGGRGAGPWYGLPVSIGAALGYAVQHFTVDNRRYARIGAMLGHGIETGFVLDRQWC
jgi:hypothetical protein